MSQWHSIVIGGGASGLLCANIIHSKISPIGMDPFVLEANPKMGKKLLATGNGRCNLTNLDISPAHYHGDPLAAQVLKLVPPQRVMEELEKLCLLCRADSEGRVYPRGNQAAAVVRALAHRPGSYDCGVPVVAVERRRGCFVVTTRKAQQEQTHTCSRLILACGGAAAPDMSGGLSGYELAKALGHTVTELSPSLVPLKTDPKRCKPLKGMRTRARVTLYKNGKAVASESGEVIFGENRISGICVLNLSARLREIGLENVELGLDLAEEMDRAELVEYLKNVRKNRGLWACRDLFSGFVNLRIGEELAKSVGIADSFLGIRKLTDQQLEYAADLCKNWRFPVTGVCSWNDAQVTAGGVPLSQVDLTTMESKLCPGLYLTGELLDVDGDCGGYNLHWAWATGILAGYGAGVTSSPGEDPFECDDADLDDEPLSDEEIAALRDMESERGYWY